MVLLRTTCEAIKLFLGWLTGPLTMPWFGRVTPCTLLTEAGGVTFVIVGPVETFAEAIRFWLNPTIVRALDCTRGELNTCEDATPLATPPPRRPLLTGSTVNVL
jgi:hypothetical protein